MKFLFGAFLGLALGVLLGWTAGLTVGEHAINDLRDFCSQQMKEVGKAGEDAIRELSR